VQHRNGADLLLLAQTIRADVAEGGVWNGNRVQEQGNRKVERLG